MADGIFLRIHDLLHRRKRWVLGVFLLVTAAAVAGVFFVPHDSTIDLMLPPDAEILRSIAFLRDSNLADKLVVSLALTSPERSRHDLFAAADRLAASLTPPHFTRVVSRISLSDAMDEFSVLRYAPFVLGEEGLAAIDQRLTPRAVADRLDAIYRQSLRPESVFTTSLARQDPLGINSLLMDRLRALPASMGYDVVVEDGHFLSRDGRHTMLIVQTPVPMMDGKRSKAMVAELREKIRGLPPYVKADLVGAHLHTVSNEEVIIRDIAVATAIASAAFLALFITVFRDIRALFVFLFPLIAAVWAVVVTALVQGKLSTLVVGFGTAIVGISDYGLIVYIAMKRGTRREDIVPLAKLVTIDAATTIFSFVVLYFSLIKGYHQLALFSTLCLVICLFFSLFVLPLVLSGKRFGLRQDPTVGDRLKQVRWPAKTAILAWTVSTGVLALMAFSVTFDSDVKKLDGSGPEVVQAERAFHAVWGGKTSQAILVVTAPTLEEALEKNDRVYRDAVAGAGEGTITNIAQFWPSGKARRENRQRWDRFWRDGREQELRRLIADAAPARGFSERAFDPFFDGLYGDGDEAPGAEGMIAQLRERFVLDRNGEYRVMSFFPDEPALNEMLADVARKHDGTFLVSGRALSERISAFTRKEMTVLVPLAVLFNIALTWMFFRNWKETFIALVPLATGAAWLLGIMAAFKMPLNVVSIVAGIIASGVIVDYGLGITYEYRSNLQFGTVMAMTLSAASNVVGAGALLFAKHPALYSTGVAMVLSMVAGYLSAMIIIPALCSMLGTGRQVPVAS